eukprot:scaffold124105_cov66-Phaeocystis_antarctica.AAC.3
MRARAAGLAPTEPHTLHSTMHPSRCRSAACKWPCIIATTASNTPASTARSGASVWWQTLISAVQPSTCTSAASGCARIAASTASSAPASAALCSRASPAASVP